MPLDHDQLVIEISALEQLLSRYSIADLARLISITWVMPNPSGVWISHYHALAPYKQTIYILAIALNSSEPPLPEPCTQENLREICERSSNIYVHYMKMFHGRDSNTAEIAAPTFLHYYTTTRMDDSSESFIKRISETCTPFNEAIKTEFGCTVNELCDLLNFIAQNLQEKANTLFSMISACTDNASLKRTYQNEIAKRLSVFNHINLNDIVNKFNASMAHSFWKNFVSRRPSPEKAKYPTSEWKYEQRPLIEISKDNAVLPMFMWLVRAVDDKCTNLILGSPLRDRYLRNRDKLLETATAKEFTKLFQSEPGIQLHYGLFEEATLHFEHDIIIIDSASKTLIICECKAGVIREPLRDPERSFIRIRDDFRKNTGIQKAYDQGNRIRRLLLSGTQVELFNKNGRVCAIKPDEIEHIYVICLTEDNYGPIACNLNHLLEKQTEEDYPWAVSLSRLAVLIDGLLYRKWSKNEFYEFLNQRKLLHGKVFADDEMEIMGIFLRNRNFDVIFRSADNPVVLDGTWGDIFGEIFQARHGGPPPDFTPRLRRIHILDKDG